MAKVTLELQSKYSEAISSTDDLITAQQKLADATKQVKQAQQDAGKAAEDSQKKAAQAALLAKKSYEELEAELQRLIVKSVELGGKETEAGKKYIEQAREVTKAIKAKKDEADAYKRKVEEVASAVAGETVAMDKQKSKIAELKAEMRSLQSAAIEAGGAQTEQGRNLLAQAGKLKDEIGDIQSATKAYASDTQTFDSIAGAAGLATNAFQGWLGATTLLGGSTEDLQQQLVKLNAIMAVTQSATNIQNTLQKESAFMRGLDSAATGIQTAAQKAYNLVVGESVGATKAFRLALAGTGIGLLVVGLIAAYEAFQKFNKAQEQSAEATKKEMQYAQMRADIYKQGAEDAAKEIAHVQALAVAIQNEKLPREERLKALQDYNKIAADGNKLTEKQIDNSKLVQEAIQRETQLIIGRATVAAAEQELQKRIQKDLADRIEAEQNLARAREALNTSTANTDIDPALVEGRRKQLQELVKLQEQLLNNAKGNLEKTQKDVAKIIKEIEDQYGTAFATGDKASGSQKREKGITVTVDKFGIDVDSIAKNSNLTFEEKARILSAFGFDTETIAKALAAAAKDGLNIDKLAPSDAQIKSVQKKLNVLGLNINLNTDKSQEELDAYSQAIGVIADNIKSTLNDAFDAAIAKQGELVKGLDDQITKQEDLLKKQEDLQKRGLANDVTTERKRLQELQKQRDAALAQQKKLQKEKMAIETAEQVSSLITAAANIFMSLSAIPGFGIPLAIATVASMIAAFTASKVLAAKSAGFAEGGYTGDGGKYEAAGTVHKGEFVMTKEKTAKHRKLLEALHSDDNAGIAYGIADLLDQTGVVLPNADLPERLQGHKSAIEMQLKNEQQQVVDELKAVKEELKAIRRKDTPTSTTKGPRIEKDGNTTKIIN